MFEMTATGHRAGEERGPSAVMLRKGLEGTDGKRDEAKRVQAVERRRRTRSEGDEGAKRTKFEGTSEAKKPSLSERRRRKGQAPVYGSEVQAKKSQGPPTSHRKNSQVRPVSRDRRGSGEETSRGFNRDTQSSSQGVYQRRSWAPLTTFSTGFQDPAEGNAPRSPRPRPRRSDIHVAPTKERSVWGTPQAGVRGSSCGEIAAKEPLGRDMAALSRA